MKEAVKSDYEASDAIVYIPQDLINNLSTLQRDLL